MFRATSMGTVPTLPSGFTGFSYVGMQLPTDGSVILPGKDLFTDNTGGVSSTSGDEGAHTHSLNTPSGLFDTGCAQGAHVFVDGTDRDRPPRPLGERGGHRC